MLLELHTKTFNLLRLDNVVQNIYSAKMFCLRQVWKFETVVYYLFGMVYSFLENIRKDKSGVMMIRVLRAGRFPMIEPIRFLIIVPGTIKYWGEITRNGQVECRSRRTVEVRYKTYHNQLGF